MEYLKIDFDFYYGWEAKTAGCGCCEGTVGVDDDAAAIDIIKQLASKHKRLAKRYTEMLYIAENYDVLASLGRISRYTMAANALQTRNSGQRESIQLSYTSTEELRKRVEDARKALFREDVIMAEFFGWMTDKYLEQLQEELWKDDKV